jgi:hypothetical protein
MPEKEPPRDDDLLGSRPGFQEWSDDIMSELEARQRLTPEEAPPRRRFARKGEQQERQERQPLPSRLLSWFSAKS